MTHDGNLVAELRHQHGKGSSRSLRREGKIPAVLYGGGGENLPLSLSPSEFRKATHPELQWNTFYQLTLKDEGKADVVQPCLIADIQIDPVRRDVIHVDFMRVDPEAEVTRKVLVEYIGRSVGVVKGGKLKTFRRSLQVAARPGYIPLHVTVDVTPVDGGESILVENIELENARIVENPKMQLCHVEMPKVKKTDAEEDKDKDKKKKKK